MSRSPIHTPLCDLLGIRVPIIQTGMGWVAGARLAAATSEAGGLGIIAAATLSYGELEETIAKVKERTDKPFGVNLRADQADIEERIALLIREQVKVASFARAPGPKAIARFKEAGILCMPTIGARKHAAKVQQWGVDLLIAQGAEGGGHTGTVPTTLLLPDVCDAVDIPVVAAGGFRDGRGLVAALAFGAAGVAMGTRFLLTAESTVPLEVKQRYLSAGVDDSVVTTAVDGYPQRVLRTDFVNSLEKGSTWSRVMRAIQHGLAFQKYTGNGFFELLREGREMKASSKLTWPQVFMAANAPMLTKAALVDGDAGSGVLPTGQVAGLVDELPTVAELIARIEAEAAEVLGALHGLSDGGTLSGGGAA